jgi:hypothetical protein
MKTFSDIPVIPSCTVSDVRPAIRSGRPTVAAFNRSKVRSSTAHGKHRTFAIRDVAGAISEIEFRQIAVRWAMHRGGT